MKAHWSIATTLAIEPSKRLWPQAVVASFEGGRGSADKEAFQSAVDDHSSPEAFIKHMQAIKGSSDFMLFLKVDHGAWLPRVGLEGRAIVYTIGNPLIARTMIRHNIEVVLNVFRTVQVLRRSHKQAGKDCLRSPILPHVAAEQR